MASTINADTTNGVVVTSDTSGEIKLQSAGADIATVNNTGITLATGKDLTANGQILSNRPIVYVTKAATQALSEATNTTIQFDTKSIDTDNAFDTSTYEFTVPTGKAGIYQIQVDARLDGKSNTNVQLAIAMIYKNNSLVKRNYWTFSANYIRTANPATNMITNLAVGDTIKGVCYINTTSNGGGDMLAGTNQSSMYIQKLIE